MARILKSNVLILNPIFELYFPDLLAAIEHERERGRKIQRIRICPELSPYARTPQGESPLQELNGIPIELRYDLRGHPAGVYAFRVASERFRASGVVLLR